MHKEKSQQTALARRHVRSTTETSGTGTRNAMPVSLLKQKIDMWKGATQNAMPVSLLKQKIDM